MCIIYLETTGTFKLKTGFIHLLPAFHCHPGEDLHKHLQEFHMVCDRMRLHGVNEEQIHMRAFPFSLKDNTKDWLYYLSHGRITTFTEMKKQFLEKFFPTSHAGKIKKDIYSIVQNQGESLYEY